MEKRATILKLTVTAICTITFICQCKISNGPWSMVNSPWSMVMHANVFHLAANLYCLWLLRKVHWLPAFVIAALASLLAPTPTVGLSGFLFASIGVSCGRNLLWKQCLITLAICMLWGLFPSVSLFVHVVSLLTGYAYGHTLRMAHR